MVPERIISGGQTGVDRAALDFAIERRFAYGGFCPKGRRAEDGVIPLHYNLVETRSADYAERTERNVDAADGTLILHRGELSSGTQFTAELCHDKEKPVFMIDLDNPADRPAAFQGWLQKNHIKTLNVAGPRESQRPGISAQAAELLRQLLERRRRPRKQ
jgi:Circularly permutated YpsA SLOG family